MGQKPPLLRVGRPRYLATSRKAHGALAGLARMAAHLDLDPWTTRPLPPDRAGLVLTRAGVRLQVPGGGRGLWPAGMTDWRLALGAEDTLARALRPRPGARIFDGTFGLGHDALVLAGLGAEVLAVEPDPALLFYAYEGLRRHAPAAARRISVRCADHRVALRETQVDHVYLDPLFPAARAGQSRTLTLLRACATDAPLTDETLRLAWAAASRSLALRQPIGAAAPAIPGLPAPLLVRSRRVQFAVWRRPDSGPTPANGGRGR